MKIGKAVRKAAAALSVAVLLSASLTAFAATTTDTGTGSVQGTVPVTGTISPLQISVTHPITASYTIDPNTDTFTAPDIVITNNTRCPVNVAVQSLSATSGGTVQFQDVLPTSQTWASLNNADSKKYIALGMNIQNTNGWNTGYSTVTDWAASATPVTFGSINSAASASMKLTAKYGYAFDSSVTAGHSLVFKFSLS